MKKTDVLLADDLTRADKIVFAEFELQEKCQMQMKSTPKGTALHSHRNLLFNRPIRALLPKMNREPINITADHEYYEILIACQDKYLKGDNTCIESHSFPIGSTVAVQLKNGGPWTYGIVEEVNYTDNNGQSYIIRVT